MTTKICTKCHIEKPLSEFYPRRDRGEGATRANCKDCTKLQLDSLPNIPYSEFSEEQKARAAKKTRKHLLKKLYGLTLEDYDRMLEEQHGKCAICKTEKVGGKHKTNTMIVDHDHKTGKVRGLLCNYCNIMAGMMEKNLETSQLVLDYLRIHTTTAP